MKLRNKKTGEIVLATNMAVGFADDGTDNWYNSLAALNEDCNWYNSLAELNEEWEDYKPAEPLIKDEKIRKAVRAWAEACGVEEYVSVSDLSPAFTRFYTNEYEIDIKTENSLCLSEREYYTIAELCGEEEE